MNPPGPLVVIRIRCVHFPVPVVREPQKLKLLSEPFYISLRSNPGMGTGSDGVLLCGETESVPPDRVQNVESLHPLVSRNDIRCCIPPRVGGGVPCAGTVRDRLQDRM